MFNPQGDDLDSDLPSDSSSSSNVTSNSPSSTSEEGFWSKIDLNEIKSLLAQETLESHEKAYQLLKEYGLTAFQRWEKIHADHSSSHHFSQYSKELVNDFAHMVLVHLAKDSKLLELGCGFGNDAIFMASQTEAEVMAIDVSQTALNEGRKQSKNEGLKIDFIQEDYMETLKKMKGANLDMVYCHSAAHYWPGRIFEDNLLRLIAQALAPSGVFCLVMKTADSASAHAESQIPLNQEANPASYLYAVDKKDRLFSIYPKTKEALFKALHKYFEIVYEEEVEVEGYNRVGEVEVFVCVIAKPLS